MPNKRIVYFHDVKLKKCRNSYYTTDGLNQSTIEERYFEFCDEFRMVTRVINDENLKIEKYSKFDDDRITFDGIEEENIYKIALSSSARKIIESNVKSADMCIIRLPGIISGIAYKYAKKYHKKYIVEVVGCAFDALWNHKKKIGKIIAPFMYIDAKRKIKNADNVIYVTEKFLQSRYPNNHNNIGCSDVIIPDKDEKIIENRVAKIENKKDNKFIFGLIGSLDANYKGQATAIKALALIKDKIDFELHFLGIGDKERWINMVQKYGIENKIYFDGTLPGGEMVYNWMDNLDIFLIPSDVEGLPRALIEAMSRGCPAIGTDVGGIGEVLDILFEKRNYKMLAQKILEFTSNKEYMKQCAIRNFNESTKYSKEKLKEKRKEFIKEVLID